MKIIFSDRDIISLLSRCLSAQAASLLFVLLVLYPSVSAARLSGDMSLTYSNYDGRANNSRRMSSSSLTQDYSLLYSSKGTVYNSRVGSYDLSLGYNWTSLDTTFKSSTQATENFSVDRGHILYRGEINLDPKEVPFKLNAYSRDMNRNTIGESTGHVFENFGSIFGARNQPTYLNSGLHIDSGVTMVAGVKNGITNGYNEIMRNFPMILVDYRDSVNRDLNTISPVNDRLSRLAFVSLNKKENWFHYRLTEYNDYLDSKNNYTERQFQLGTVDESMARRWIDFSNWLKVSTDLQFTRRKNNDQKYALEDINLNLFVTAERTKWNARMFSSFDRYRDENSKLSYLTTLPLYVEGIVDQDMSWNTRASFRDSHDVDITGARSSFVNMLVGYRVDAYKRAPFTLSQSFDVESSRTNLSDFVTLSGVLESVSTPRFSRDVTLGASYNIKNSVTSSSTDSDSSFLEQGLDLRGGYAPTNTLRFDLTQKTTLTRGNQSPFNGTTRDSTTLIAQYVNPRDLSSSEVGTESLRSFTVLSSSWNPKPRLNFNLSLTEDIYKTSTLGVSPVTDVAAGVTFTNEAWSINDTFKYTRGSRLNMDDNSDSISESVSVRYIHSRNLDASVSGSYTAGYASSGSSHETSVEQRLNYTYFTRSGIARKLLELNETFLYTDGTVISSREYKKGVFLGMKYYPITRLTLAAGVGYTYDIKSSDQTLIWNASVAANFQMLQASIDYMYGTRKNDGARESKITGNIRKSF